MPHNPERPAWNRIFATFTAQNHEITALLSAVNASTSFLETLAQDELTRIVRYIDPSTLFPLIATEGCPFGSVFHLIISELRLCIGSEIEFGFRSSTLCVGWISLGIILKLSVPLVKNFLEGLRIRDINYTLATQPCLPLHMKTFRDKGVNLKVLNYEGPCILIHVLEIFGNNLVVL